MVVSNQLICVLVLSLLLGCSTFADSAITANGKHGNNGNDHNDNRSDIQGDQTIIQTAKEVMNKEGSFLKGASGVVKKQSNENDLMDLEPLERLYRLLGDYLMCRYHKRPNCESEIGEKNVQGLKDHLPPPEDWRNNESNGGILLDRLENVYNFPDSRRHINERHYWPSPWKRNDRFQNKISPSSLFSGVKLPIGNLPYGNPGGPFELGRHPQMKHSEAGPIPGHWGNEPFMTNPVPQPMVGDHMDERRDKKLRESWIVSPQFNNDHQLPFREQPWQPNTAYNGDMFLGAVGNTEPSMIPTPYGPNLLRH